MMVALLARKCHTKDQNNKRIVLALQSGLKSELTWALSMLTLLSFKEKDEVCKDATPLARVPGLLDALLQVMSMLMLLSFEEKDEVCKDATPLAKVPGLLDALLQVIAAGETYHYQRSLLRHQEQDLWVLILFLVVLELNTRN